MQSLGKTCKLTYGHERSAFDAPVGTRLLDAILRVEPNHRHVCGGNGFCTSCRVRITSGVLTNPSRIEIERLGNRCGELRLACQSYLVGDVSVIPAAGGNLIDWE